jgi:small-conductance mechanosensitive channel
VALGIAYKEDIDHAISVIKKAVSKLAYVLSEPKPEVWTEQLADSSINLKVLTWIPRDEWDNVGPILLKEIKKEIDDAGIEIPFPQRVIHHADKTKSFEATK